MSAPVIIGNATLYLGDCLEVMRQLPDNSVDAVVTSPPYAMQRAKLYGGVPEDEYPSWTVAWMEQVRRILKPHGSVLINIREHIRNGEMSDYVHRTRLALREAGWIECDEMIWVKPDAPPVGHPGRPRRSWERILWFAKGNQPWCDPKANGRLSRFIGVSPTGDGFQKWLSGSSDYREGIARCRDWVRVPVASNDSRGHPATYPRDLAAWMIRLITSPGGTVLDPFAGSGTTLLAAVQEGFNAIGIERVPEYFDISCRRIEDAHRQGLMFV